MGLHKRNPSSGMGMLHAACCKKTDSAAGDNEDIPTSCARQACHRAVWCKPDLCALLAPVHQAQEELSDWGECEPCCEPSKTSIQRQECNQGTLGLVIINRDKISTFFPALESANLQCSQCCLLFTYFLICKHQHISHSDPLTCALVHTQACTCHTHIH